MPFRIFLSYSSQDVDIAEKIYLALIGENYEVFFDREVLPKSGNYNKIIRNKIKKSDLLIFLISRGSIRKSSYALTELKYFQERFSKPEDMVLPILIDDTVLSKIPNYLLSVTILEIEGNIPAEVVHEVNKISEKRGRSYSFIKKLYWLVFLSITLSVYYYNNFINIKCPPPLVHESSINLDTNMIKIDKVSYTMGSTNPDDEIQAKNVNLKEFLSDKYKVTNNQYKKFIEISKYETQGDWDSDIVNRKGFHPVTNITWNDASAYCKYIGKRLPTEEEWEYLCRGKMNTYYPWGDSFDRKKANINNLCNNGTIEVGSFNSVGGDNSLGVSGLFGNALEWTSSSISVGNTDYKIARGQSYQKSLFTDDCLTQSRLDSSDYNEGISFRCVK
ncbi:MAG: SUMF1/EgtB/PvdO family nonheme iron enzyme [bacterium]